MDLKAYLAILKRNLVLIIVVIVLFVGAAWFWTARQALTYSASASLNVTRSGQKQTDVTYYQYDNYYTNLSANSISDNLVGWVSSPATVSEIYKKAGMDLPNDNLQSLGKIFTAKKKISTAAVIDISYTSTNADQSKNLIETASVVLKDKVEQYNQTSDSGSFHVILSSPVVVQDPKAYLINVFIAAFAGLLISLAVAFGKEALK